MIKRQISTELAPVIPLQILAGALVVAAVVFFMKASVLTEFIVSLVLLPALGFAVWHFSAAFRKISFDANYIYISRSAQTKKIDLANVVDIKTGALPIALFYLNAYIITIAYTENCTKKKIRFLSKGAFRERGSVRGIPHLDKLKESVLQRKYNEQIVRVSL